MKQVAGLFKGVHDFRNFVAGERDNYDCIIYNIDFEIEDNILNIIFEGKSFYRYMVRNLVGAMIEVGRGKEDISKVEKMLNLEENTSLFTAPSNGLYLESVIYDEN
jgi:tRNA pseudouridine38-40 synthase